jgi:uncharacterized membrane protein
MARTPSSTGRSSSFRGGAGSALADDAPGRSDPGDRFRGTDRDNAYGADLHKAQGRHGATAHDGAAEPSDKNVNGIERLLSVAAGGALAAYGLRRRDWGGLAAGVVGGMLVERGVSGHCMVYDAAGLTSAADEGGRFAMPHHEEGGLVRQHGGSATVDAKKAKRVMQTFTIFGRMPGELYDYWRRLENLPRILQHLESVKELDTRRSHWVAKAPAGQTVEWDAEIINDVPGEVIAWRSLPGASVPNAGAVTFREAPAGRGTEIKVNLEYEPPLGRLGVAVARLFGEEPSVQVREDLRRYKALMEAGEIPVSYNPGQGKPPKTTFDAQVNLGWTGGDVRGLQQQAASTRTRRCTGRCRATRRAARTPRSPPRTPRRPADEGPRLARRRGHCASTACPTRSSSTRATRSCASPRPRSAARTCTSTTARCRR